MMRRFLCAVGLIVLLLATPVTALAADPVDYGETVYGSISNSNWNDYWDFYGSAGDEISITLRMTSGNLDPWLTLWEQDSSGDWISLAVDDDGGGGNDAKITYTLSTSGRYVIEATRYGDEGGSTSGGYSLTLSLLSGSSSFAGNPFDNWDDVSPGCPSGWHCLDNVATRWNSLNTLTYCITPSAGTTEYLGGKSVSVWSDFQYEQDLQTAINYWDNLLASFSLREVSCSSNPDFKFGLINPADLAKVTGKNTTIGVAYPPDPKPARIFVRSDMASGNERQLVIAHEIGHGLGLGHSQTSGTLMYPEAPAAGTSLASIGLGGDSMDQMANAYPNNVTWSSQNDGFNKDVFEAVNGVAETITVQYPQGASRVIALCMIEGYWARGTTYGDDADMGWNCYFNIDNDDQEVTFTLAPSYSNEGKIRATALVLNLDAYDLHHLYHFHAYGDNPSPICIGSTEYTDYTNTTPRYNVTPQITYPAGSIPIVAVTRYDTWSVDEPDDDMSFGVYLEDNTFNAYAWDGCGEVEGWVAVISPSSTDYRVENCWLAAGDYYPYNQIHSFTLPSTNPNCNVSILDGWNNEVFSSLVVYSANGDDHFSASNHIDDNGNILTNSLWVNYGDDQSEVWFEVIGLKSR